MATRLRFPIWTLLMAAVLMLTCSCASVAQVRYYKFSGSVVSDETGEPVPCAAVYIAEKKSDFFQSPRLYRDEAADPAALEMAKTVFGREGANRYLYFRSGSDGTFTTVWRQDYFRRRFFPLAMWGKRSLPSIALYVGAPGHQSRSVQFAATHEDKPFVGSNVLTPLPDNDLGKIEIESGSDGPLLIPPIETKYLAGREPPLPEGPAHDLCTQAEAAFREGDYQTAIDMCDKAMAKSPHDPNAWLIKADSYYMMGEYQKSLDECGGYLKAYPEVGFIYKVAADAAMQLQNWDIDLYCLMQGQQIDPERPDFYPDLCVLDSRCARQPANWPVPEAIWK